MQAKRGNSWLWLYALCWSIVGVATVCSNNYVNNPSASTSQNWNIYQPSTSQNGSTISNGLFRIETTGAESSQRGYFSQEITIPNGASNFTISGQMKRRVASAQGSPSLRVDLLNKQGTRLDQKVSTDLVGTTSTWKTYSHSFYLPDEATKLRVKLWVESRLLGHTPSPNTAYFDNICVIFATLGASVPSVTTTVGKPASLLCVLSGVNQGTFIWGTSDDTPVDPHRAIVSSSGSTSTLHFVKPEVLDEGNYTCHATTNAGNTSATGSFLVYVKPHFTTVPSPKTVKIGDDLTLPCGVAGRPSPTVTWYNKDNRPISYSYISINPTTHDLTIHAVNATRDTGIYRCNAVNKVGSINRIYNLTLDPFGKVVSGPTEESTITAAQRTDTELDGTEGYITAHNADTEFNGTAEYITAQATYMTMSRGTHPSVNNTEKHVWDREFLGLVIYVWIAIGTTVVIILVLIIACCAALQKRKSKRKKLLMNQNMASVRYNRSRRAGYAVSDTARIVGPGNHMHSHPDSYYPEGTIDSGYNSNRPSVMMHGNEYPPGRHMNMDQIPLRESYQLGQVGQIGHHVPHHNHIHFPQDSNQLVPRIPTEDELEGHDNPNFYEELPDVLGQTVGNLEQMASVMPLSQKEEYVTMQPIATSSSNIDTRQRLPTPNEKQTSKDRKHRRQFSSMDESNLDAWQNLPKPDEAPPLPIRPSSMAPRDEGVKRLSIGDSEEKRRSIEADVPDTPGDIDYRL